MKKILASILTLSFLAIVSPADATTIYAYQDGVKLGSVLSYSGSATTTTNWNSNHAPDIGPSVGDNEGAFFFYNGSDGLSFNILLNNGDGDNENGSYAFDATVSGSSSSILYADDTGEFTGSGGVYHGQWAWSWGADGGGIGMLSGDWEINITNILNGWSSRYSNALSSLLLFGEGSSVALNPDGGDIMLTNVSAVPVPPAALLFGSAIIGFAGVKRYRKKILI